MIFSLASYTKAQKLLYNVYWGNDHIGTMKVNRSIEGTLQYYEFIADVKFKVFWKPYHRETTLKATYRNDTLIFCSNRSMMNGDLKDWRYLKWMDEEYRGKANEDSIRLSKPITESVSRLYYHRPDMETHVVFAEGQTDYMDFKYLGDQSFRMDIPGGNNVYKYDEEGISEVFVDRTWFNLVFRKVD